MLDIDNFKCYRKYLGYTNQNEFKIFLSAKDIKPSIDYDYVENLNSRLCKIYTKINKIYYKPCDIDKFLDEKLFEIYKKIKTNTILPRLNNQGRRVEEVYFSWMRGYLSCEYFKGAISDIFDIDVSKIQNIDSDDFSSLESFRRTPSADLEFNDIRLEIQSGFQGVNDIKQHKVLEAKKLENKTTFVMHFDLFNGQVAIVNIKSIADDDINWITRQQMEGQTVFNINQNYFTWSLLTAPPKHNFERI